MAWPSAFAMTGLRCACPGAVRRCGGAQPGGLGAQHAANPLMRRERCHGRRARGCLAPGRPARAWHWPEGRCGPAMGVMGRRGGRLLPRPSALSDQGRARGSQNDEASGLPPQETTGGAGTRSRNQARVLIPNFPGRARRRIVASNARARGTAASPSEGPRGCAPPAVADERRLCRVRLKRARCSTTARRSRSSDPDPRAGTRAMPPHWPCAAPLARDAGLVLWKACKTRGRGRYAVAWRSGLFSRSGATQGAGADTCRSLAQVLFQEAFRRRSLLLGGARRAEARAPRATACFASAAWVSAAASSERVRGPYAAEGRR